MVGILQAQEVVRFLFHVRMIFKLWNEDNYTFGNHK